MTRIWSAYVEQDGDDLILPLPDEVLQELGWESGDTLKWVQEGDKWILTRSRTGWKARLKKVKRWLRLL